ncbi:SpoIID/LytB domain-containing protein [Rhodococcus sp. NPDC058514]|uniref:SpoIID/LytB domain-containing protein n=1 Tax=unclassified Rhodococcus (in: high G+C Gram-positive bacteria) TaxID=192944 RepID=UPI003653F63F
MARTRRKKFVVGRPMRSGWKPLAMRAAILGLAPALLVGGTVGVVVATRSAGPDVAETVAADAPYTITGYGHGHGRGMGQWGAYGYAKQGWTAERILGYYYGGTTLDVLGDKAIGVRLQGLDGKGLDVFSDSPMGVAGRTVAPGEAAHLTANPGGGATVVVTRGCDGDVLWQESTPHPWVDPVDLAPDRPANEHLKLCGGGVPFRGSLGVALEGEAPRVVNHVDMEDYLLGVVPAESKAEWADTGGAEALRAQAVAARSYAAAEKRYAYAETCDTQDCQVYGGSSKEHPKTSDAVRSTTGKVLMKEGKPVSAEFSASTGGYSAGGAFGAVEDLGDTESPNHKWTQTLTAGEIATAFGVGELHSIEVTSRNNLGADGGRVTGLRVAGSTGTKEATGDEARTKLGLKSDWFTIAEGVGPAAPPPASALAAPGVDNADPTGELEPTDIERKYAELGGHLGVLGAPVGPELSMPDEAGRFRMFTHGAIVWTKTTGAQVLDASVLTAKLPGLGS